MTEISETSEFPTGWRALVPAIKEAVTYNKGLTNPETQVLLPLGMALVYGVGTTLAAEIVLAGLNALDGIYPWHVMVLHVTNLFAALALFAGAAIAAAAARRLDRLPVMIVGLATFSLVIFVVQLAFSFVWPNSSGGNVGVVTLLNYWVVRNSLRLGMGWSILVAILLVALMTGAGLLILFGTADGQYLLPALMEARKANAS